MALFLSASQDKEMVKFETATPKSKAVYEKAKIDVPFGVHSTYRYSDPYPLYFTRSKGYEAVGCGWECVHGL